MFTSRRLIARKTTRNHWTYFKWLQSCTASKKIHLEAQQSYQIHHWIYFKMTAFWCMPTSPSRPLQMVKELAPPSPPIGEGTASVSIKNCGEKYWITEKIPVVIIIINVIISGFWAGFQTVTRAVKTCRLLISNSRSPELFTLRIFTID